VLRLALGLSESLYLPAAISLLADHHDASTRGRALGMHTLGIMCGVVFGGAFAGAAAQHLSWRFGFIALGLAGLGLAAYARRRITDAGGRDGQPAAPRQSAATALRYLAGTPSFYVLLFKTMLAGFGIWIFLNWLPLYFHEKFQMSLGTAGFVGTFITQGANIIGLAAGGWVSDRAARRDPRLRMLVTAVCHLVAAPLLLLFLSPAGYAPVIVAVSLFALLRGIGEASEKPCLCDLVPACYRATAVGLMNMLATAAGGVGVLLAGVLKGAWGLDVVFAGCAGTFVLAGGILLAGYAWPMPRDLARARAFMPPPGSTEGGP
jgi:predicted MFS family arabinose efflux permease